MFYVTQKKVERNEKNPNMYKSFNVPKVCQILKHYARCMLGHFSKHKILFLKSDHLHIFNARPIRIKRIDHIIRDNSNL